jgi:NADH-quinone oxidoreductase subunit N
MLVAALRTPAVDWLALSPTLALLGASALALLAAVLLPPSWRRPMAAGAVAAAFVAAFVCAALLFERSPGAERVVAAALVRDRLGALAVMVVAASGLLTVAVSYARRFRRHTAEYYGLLAAAAAGMAFLVGADNLMTIFLGLEWFSIALYVLCALDVERRGSLEAGLKYLIVGGFGSAFLLFGFALVYGATGQLGLPAIAQATEARGLEDDALLVAGLAMILAGLGFKASAAPFHMWTPDVYEGAPTPVTGFMAAATKTVAVVVALRLLATGFPALADLWQWAVAGLVVASLLVGNLAALVQRDLKRLLAYSSISHAGFLLMGVAAGSPLGGKALLYYLIPYAAMSVGAFAVVAARERELARPVTLDSLAGMGWERPLLGAAMWAFMLGFAGLPLTGGFVGKFYVLSAVYERGWIWLVIVGLAATAVSLYYYLGVVRVLYMRAPGELGLAPAGGSPPRDLALQAAVLACLIVTVVSFFAVEPLVDLAGQAAAALPF